VPSRSSRPLVKAAALTCAVVTLTGSHSLRLLSLLCPQQPLGMHTMLCQLLVRWLDAFSRVWLLVG
jgi:hypothetical protein